MKKNIQKVEVDLIQMKANMNAINGAIQQTDRLLNRLKNEGEEKSKKMGGSLAPFHSSNSINQQSINNQSMM